MEKITEQNITSMKLIIENGKNYIIVTLSDGSGWQYDASKEGKKGAWTKITPCKSDLVESFNNKK